MRKQPISFAFSLMNLWVLMILFGAIFFETLIIYPNIFHDIPRSFETGMAFMVVKGPHDFFPPVGTLALLTGIGSLIMNWRVKPARYWILSSVLIIFIGEYLFSMAYFWPKNTIMFEEGTTVHSVVFLKQTAQAFQTGHWFRVAGCAAASACSFKGFLNIYRYRITLRHVHPES
ncbi:hypothetical protein [Lihuaxuella thermophila]|uniref:DUF1772 domain-containing protein n=1 Tax=Lihuaxuella thermophila TaxID=1173111 RepID=A0A1H8ISX1_9BACL|nr:hypothetical protein [Lihuaxuella thermophila]SEN71501.1 hypothetical protein SAMN05444955_11935 [Lihuaxuella thermophila]